MRFTIDHDYHIHSTVSGCCYDPERTALYIKRFEKLLESNLPFGRVGIAHPTTHLIANQSPSPYLEVLNGVSDSDFYELFRGAKEKNLGIELNFKKCSDEAFEKVMRPFFIAKDCGCKFYVGSDSHALKAFEPAYATIERAIDTLGLTEDDKFHF